MNDGRQEQQRRLRRQLEARGIRDSRVLDVIEHTRRHLFVPQKIQSSAYDDNAFPIGCGQTISQPYIVALMTEALQLQGHETVLEIGTGSGYQTAILAELCNHVVTVERIQELSNRAQSVLGRLAFTNIEFHLGDGTLGYRELTPYEGILVSAAAPEVPAPLFNQLAMGGKLVIPIGNESIQELQSIEKQKDAPMIQNLCSCRFVKLIGEVGWSDE